MKRPSKPMDAAAREKMLAELHRDVALRQRGYRERAMKLFPHVCARCGRGFEGRRLRELTVHHRDHNHDNNPPDGSNWELLCLYCHDHEHEGNLMAGLGAEAGGERAPPGTFNPFSNLDSLLKKDGPPEAGPPGEKP